MQNWTSQEDQNLLSLFEKIQVYNRWKEISKKMVQLGFTKTELQCRNRYHNKLNPNLNFDLWSKKEIQNIFKFYDEYGSKWNLIQTFLPGRTQNNIKNRFFSTLKNLLRKLLKKFTDASKQKSLKYISSRDVTDLYEGKGKFKKFKGFLKKILKKINFQIEYRVLNVFVQEHESILIELLNVFIQQGSEACKFKDEESKKQNLLNSQKTNNIESYPQTNAPFSTSNLQWNNYGEYLNLTPVNYFSNFNDQLFNYSNLIFVPPIQATQQMPVYWNQYGVQVFPIQTLSQNL